MGPRNTGSEHFPSVEPCHRQGRKGSNIPLAQGRSREANWSLRQNPEWPHTAWVPVTTTPSFLCQRLAHNQEKNVVLTVPFVNRQWHNETKHQSQNCHHDAWLFGCTVLLQPHTCLEPTCLHLCIHVTTRCSVSWNTADSVSFSRELETSFLPGSSELYCSSYHIS